MTTILSISAHDDIRRIMNRLVNQREGWQGQSAADFTEAKAMLSKEEFDLVLMGAGVSEQEEEELKSACANLTYQPKLVRHYGGGSGLLYSEVLLALEA
jgi:DNA-binding NtrC family response regulator